MKKIISDTTPIDTIRIEELGEESIIAYRDKSGSIMLLIAYTTIDYGFVDLDVPLMSNIIMYKSTLIRDAILKAKKEHTLYYFEDRYQLAEAIFKNKF